MADEDRLAGAASVEKAVAFGPNRSLVGVWTTPAGGSSGSPPAMLLLNSGVIHHVGSWRLHTRLARALAAEGFSSLRFDLSGIGDSERRNEAATLEENVAKDVADAISYVRDVLGVDRVVLLGLCSGARDSLEAAERDASVTGVVTIDLVADLQTRRHYLQHFGRRLFILESWWNTITGRNRVFERATGALRSRSSAASSKSEEEAQVGLRFAMSRQHVSRVVATLFERDANLLFVYSAGLEGNYNHESQLREALPEHAAHPNLSVEFFSTADHTFSRVARQAELISVVTGWMRNAFASASIAAAGSVATHGGS